MIHALFLSALLMAPPAAVPPTPKLDWGLDGRLGVNEDGRPVLGLTWTPNKKYPIGVFLDAQAVEWDEVNSQTVAIFRRYSSEVPRISTFSSTHEKSDVKVSAGVAWKFR